MTTREEIVKFRQATKCLALAMDKSVADDYQPMAFKMASALESAQQALAEKGAELAAANERIEAYKVYQRNTEKEIARLQIPIGPWEDQSEAVLQAEIAQLRTTIRTLTDDNDRQAKEIERLTALNTELEACTKGDRICMWCRQVIELSGDKVGDAAALANHMLHCKDHPVRKFVDLYEAASENNAILKARVEALEKALVKCHDFILSQQLWRGCDFGEEERQLAIAALNPQQETPNS
ncbi:MAG: hypothetical protein WC455_18175 [Dehalococcoidia bacterium]|jgi:hypothetical protein